jgi:hypothetical protein
MTGRLSTRFTRTMPPFLSVMPEAVKNRPPDGKQGTPEADTLLPENWLVGPLADLTRLYRV